MTDATTSDYWCKVHHRGLEGCESCGDPFPYVGEHGSRHAYPGTLNGKRLTFNPRDGYIQNREDYKKGNNNA